MARSCDDVNGPRTVFAPFHILFFLCSCTKFRPFSPNNNCEWKTIKLLIPPSISFTLHRFHRFCIKFQEKIFNLPPSFLCDFLAFAHSRREKIFFFKCAFSSSHKKKYKIRVFHWCTFNFLIRLLIEDLRRRERENV